MLRQSHDTGDTGVTSTADPEWDGDGRGALALPKRPNSPPALGISTERPQPQELQHDTGILPSLQPKLNKCSLAGKAKSGRVSWLKEKAEKRRMPWLL